MQSGSLYWVETIRSQEIIMSLPSWADAGFSAEIPKLRMTGEGMRIEFKEMFPQQAHRLAEEIAALATCGGGTILLGVCDNGDAIGLQAGGADERDELVRRAIGIVHMVQPQVRFTIKLGADDDKLILGIVIEKQDDPVYYYDSRPYIRDRSISRRAEPDEVKSRVWAHPSSDHVKRMQDLNYQMSRDMVDGSRKRQEMADQQAYRRF